MKNGAPLVVTFVLQYSVEISAIVAVGRLGKIELGAASRKLNDQYRMSTTRFAMHKKY